MKIACLAEVWYSPSGRTGLTTGCNWLEFKEETKSSADEDVVDEDEDVEEDEDDKTASLDTEVSLPGDEDVVLLTTAIILTPRALKSKSSPSSSSSTTYSKKTENVSVLREFCFISKDN